MWIQDSEWFRVSGGRAARIVLLMVVTSWLGACNEIDATKNNEAFRGEPAPGLVERAEAGEVDAQLAVGFFYQTAADQSEDEGQCRQEAKQAACARKDHQEDNQHRYAVADIARYARIQMRIIRL